MENFLTGLVENLRKGPLGPVVRWVEEHPRLSMWIILATGMIIILYLEAKDVVGIQPGNWAWIIGATIAVAGLCVWIVTWEDEEEESAPDKTPTVAAVAAPAAGETSPSAAKSGKATKATAKPVAKKGTGRLSQKSGKKK